MDIVVVVAGIVAVLGEPDAADADVLKVSMLAMKVFLGPSCQSTLALPIQRFCGAGTV